MSGLLPSELEPDVNHEQSSGDLRVLSLDDDNAEQLIRSLSSDTARAIYAALQDGPATASELADDAETSLQNVRHHLSNLEEAGLVRVADTRYSCKGREMKVYAPTQDSLVVCVGSTDDKDRLLDSLDSIVGVGATVALVALLVQRLFGAGVVDLGGPGTVPRVGDSVDGVTPILGLLPPGVAFLAGGLFALAALLAWERVR